MLINIMIYSNVESVKQVSTYIIINIAVNIIIVIINNAIAMTSQWNTHPSLCNLTMLKQSDKIQFGGEVLNESIVFKSAQ